MTYKLPFPAWLKQQRIVNGWTVQQFADRSGIPERTMRSYEDGSRSPSLESARGIASALRVRLDLVAKRIAAAGAP